MKSTFTSDGYVVLRGIVDKRLVDDALADAEKIRADEEHTHPKNFRARWQNHIDSGEPLLDVIDPITDLSDVCREIAHHPEILAALETLLEDRVHLFKDKLIYKPPGALGHGWHQDYIAWPGFPKSFTTVLVALDAADEQNGCLEVFGGAHARGYLSATDGDYHDLPASLFDQTTKRRLELAPGDAVVFGCYLPHGSGPNRSMAPRRHLYLSYNKAAEGGDARSRHYRQFHTWLRNRYAEYGATDFYFK